MYNRIHELDICIVDDLPKGERIAQQPSAKSKPSAADEDNTKIQ